MRKEWEEAENYVSLSEDWISNVESGLSVKDCYPFDADPTLEMADLLKRRVAIIENSIIPNIDEIELPPLVNGSISLEVSIVKLVGKAWL
ncbi:hypothetical protein [Pedobacter sp. NJ-S-72]